MHPPTGVPAQDTVEVLCSICSLRLLVRCGLAGAESFLTAGEIDENLAFALTGAFTGAGRPRSQSWLLEWSQERQQEP